MLLAPSNVVSFAVALGAGLLIGIERERRKGAGAARALAGVRTFTLTSLAGALAQALQQPLLVAAGAVLTVVLIAIATFPPRCVAGRRCPPGSGIVRTRLRLRFDATAQSARLECIGSAGTNEKGPDQARGYRSLREFRGLPTSAGG